jgi:hypothetical protein
MRGRRMAIPIAAADPASATAPNAISTLPPPPGSDAPPAPVSGAPAGRVLVGVDVGVLVGVEVGVLVGVEVGVLVGVEVGVEVGVLVGVGWLGVGPALTVEYELPSEDSLTKVSCTYSKLPVPASCAKQATAKATVPPSATSVTPRSPLMGPWNVPLNAAVGAFTTFETRLAKLPLVLNTDTTADFWKPVGHPSVVDQVGVDEAAPLAGLRLRLPGSKLLAARANPAVSSPAPAIIPSAPVSKNARRIPVTVLHLAFAPRREPRRSLVTGMAVDATAWTANSGSTSGEKLEND